MGSFATRWPWDLNVIVDTVKISRRIPSTCAQNVILCKLIISIIPSSPIYIAIDNTARVPSVTCFTTCSDLWNYLQAADNLSHAESVQSYGCQCFLTCTIIETRYKLPEFSGIVVSTTDSQYSTKA
jgi:hypothetical protein